MQLKTNNLKFIIKGFTAIALFAITTQNSYAQQVVVTDSTAIQPAEAVAEARSNVNNNARQKVDGIAGVIGSYVILNSDIDLMYEDLKNQGVSAANYNDCMLLGSLMENKLYAHHATQDSIVVSNAELS